MKIHEIDNLLDAFNEAWNDSNPTEKINPDLLELIYQHFIYAYVVGFENLYKYLNKDLFEGRKVITTEYARRILHYYGENRINQLCKAN